MAFYSAAIPVRTPSPRNRFATRRGANAITAFLVVSAILATSQPGLAITTLAPSWVRTLGTAANDQGWGIDLGPAGEVYVAGFVAGQGLDVFLARLDASGGVAWQTTWTRPFDQKAFEARYADGFLYVGGVAARTGSPTSQDMLLARVWAGNGTTDWETTWNGPADLYDEVDGIVVEDPIVYVSGWADVRLDYTEGDLVVAAFSVNGSYVRHVLWGGPGREEGNGALVADLANLYVAGIVDGVNLFAGGDAVVVAFNKTTFAEAWNATWGGAAVDDAFGLALHGNRLYGTGLTTSFGGDRIFLLTLDTDGTILRNETWGGSAAEAARAVAVSPNGSTVYIAGRTSSYGNGSFDVALLAFDASGRFVSDSTWGGAGSDVSHGIAVTDDAIYIVGETASQGLGGTDLFAMRVGPGDLGGTTGPPTPSGNPAALVVAIVAVGAVIAIVLWARSRRRRVPPASP